MIGLRTDVGESNRHYFYSVDYTVWTEGGSPINVSDAISGEGHLDTNDTFFWQSIFRIHAPNLKYEFKSIGSKDTIMDLAHRIGVGRVTNAIVCMDRDYQLRRQYKKAPTKVISTHGYSWENDAICVEEFAEYFGNLVTENQKTLDLKETMKAEFNSLVNYMKKFILLDIELNSQNVAFLPKQAPLSLIVLKDNGIATINKTRLKTLLKNAANSAHRPLHCKVRKSPKTEDIFGKLLMRFLYHMMRASLVSATGKKRYVDYDLVVRSVLKSKLENPRYRKGSVFRHFEKSFTKLNQVHSII